MEQPSIDRATLSRISAAVQRATSSPDGNIVLDKNAAISLAQDLFPLLAEDDGYPQTKNMEALALALCERYERLNEWDDLENALEILQNLIEDTDEDDHPKVARLSQLYARCKRHRFMRSRDEEDLEEAVKFGNWSVDSSRVVNDIKNETLAEPTDWTSLRYLAIDCGNEARALVRDEVLHTMLGRRILSDLGIFLQVKFERDPERSFQCLEEAIALGRLIAGMDLDNLGDRAEAQSNLSLRLTRAAKYYSEQDQDQPGLQALGQPLLDEAVSLMYECMATEEASPITRMINAFAFVQDIEKLPKAQQPSVLRRVDKLLRHAVALLSQTAIGSVRNDQRDLLTSLYGLGRCAVAAALEAGAEPFEALQLLEHGRGLLLSAGYRKDISQLLEQYPVLAQEHSSLKAELRSVEFESKRFEERLALAERLAIVRASIQGKPGFEEFDKLMIKEELVSLASEGPVVVINVTNLRSDALVVSSEGVRTIALPDIDEDKLSTLSWEHQWRLADTENPDVVFADLHRNLLRDLQFLWRRLLKPLLNDLGYTKVDPDPPRVWWVLTGVLTLFPVHAAGSLRGDENVMRYFASSYTPSLTALAQARASAKTVKPDNSSSLNSEVLVVSMEETPDQSPLPQSADEVVAVRSAFPAATVLHNPLRRVVVDALRQNPTIVHFTSHGETVYEDPFQSTLLLRDWKEAPLTVDDLQRLDLRGTQLGFLSACFAAHAGVENMQDESLHLASALQVAGFSSVVASLWYVTGDATLQVTRKFYEYFNKVDGFHHSHVARALHHAILELRESTRDDFNDREGDPIVWAPFVHFGI